MSCLTISGFFGDVFNSTPALNLLSECLYEIVVSDLGDGILGIAEVTHELAQGFFLRLFTTVDIIFCARVNVHTPKVST